MADIICKLYNDYSKLKQMSNSGKVLIDLYFSKDKAKEIISLDIWRKISGMVWTEESYRWCGHFWWRITGIKTDAVYGYGCERWQKWRREDV